MANIRVDSLIPVFDGQALTFRSPADCSQVNGLIVYYPDGDSVGSKVFQFADAHGNNVGHLDLFASDVVVKVILDTDTGLAFVQNADTNAYLESRFRNTNLLRNYWFTDPINQRGQTEYGGSAWAYTIDGWKVQNANTKVTVGNGVTVSTTKAGVAPYMIQPLNEAEVLGKTVTLSVMTGDGTVHSASGTIPADKPSGNMTCLSVENVGMVMYFVGYWWVVLTSGHFLTVKLELGTAQTLAYQDAEGNWVLNDPAPDKSLELLKCCMSTVDSSDTYANNKTTAAALGATTCASGVYVGTDTYGSDNPNTLTFDFVPKLIIIASDVRKTGALSEVWHGAFIVPQWGHYFKVGKDFVGVMAGCVSVSGCTVSWYAGNAAEQLNDGTTGNGAFTYSYTAFG